MSSKSKKKKNAAEELGEVSFEDALARLEELVDRLEEGEVPLQESLSAYAEGTRLVRHCMKQLEDAEQTLKTLSEDTGGDAGDADGNEDDGENTLF